MSIFRGNIEKCGRVANCLNPISFIDFNKMFILFAV